ncbi:phytoene/squalene synthase family protein [Halosegnis marinus]|uniref:Phytoene/squalene synthase family protein n=1 Tax=Halosegnis marinus TaxID=3034023 RepID=A0ABD5ZLX8_9EURY|nr:phytoene/squalene synthase family protein [Halosegnis sp. DT85]
MVDESQLAESKSIHKATGKTFYYATRVLPKRVRDATYVLYAFFRVADEVVDDAQGVDAEEQRRRLAEIREAALGRTETDDAVLAAFAEMREAYGIPDEEVETFVDAMAADIDTSRYHTYDQLREYMRGSAAAVGVMMTYVMDGEETEVALPHATTLGEAFQMTNFLRDVGEDIVERDRVYLPIETLEEFGSGVDDIRAREPTDGFRRAVQSELHRTEELYREGVAGIKYLPKDCQFAVLLSAVLYADHHRLIRARDYDTLTDTPSLSTARKVSLSVRTRWHWLWNKDPEAVFAKVSAVPSGDARRHAEPGAPSPAR